MRERTENRSKKTERQLSKLVETLLSIRSLFDTVHNKDAHNYFYWKEKLLRNFR